MIISSIRKILGLKNIDDQLERLKELEKGINDNDNALDLLSKEYRVHKNLYDHRSDMGDEIAKSIETRYNHFASSYDELLSKTIKDRNKLIKERKSILDSENIKIALEAIDRHKKSFDTLKKAVKDGVISMDQYNDSVKEKQGGKVKYADNIVINENGEILLVKRASWDDTNRNAWVIPGGHVDPGEDFKEAALRELGEESGIWIKEEDKTRTNLGGTYEDDNCVIHYFITYVDKDDYAILLQNEETVAYEWIKQMDIDSYDMVFNMKDNIKKILNLNDRLENVTRIKKAISDGILDQTAVESIVKSKDKLALVMQEFKDGKLMSNGKKVTDEKQALAIALSESGLKKDDNTSLSDQKNKKKEKEESDNEDQVDKSIDNEDDIEKAKRGVYENNHKNRKLGRVGVTYGIKDLAKETDDPEYKKEYNKAYEELKKKINDVIDKKYFIHLDVPAKTTNSKYLYVASLRKTEGEGDDFLLRISDHPSNRKGNRGKIFEDKDIVFDKNPDRMMRQVAKILDVDYDFKKTSRVKDYEKGDSVAYYKDGKYVKGSIANVNHENETLTLDDGHVMDYDPRYIIKADKSDKEMERIINEEEERIQKQAEFKKLYSDNMNELNKNGGYFGEENRDLLLKEKVRRGFLSKTGHIIANEEVYKQVAHILAENNIRVPRLSKSIDNKTLEDFRNELIDKSVIDDLLSKKQ